MGTSPEKGPAPPKHCSYAAGGPLTLRRPGELETAAPSCHFSNFTSYGIETFSVLAKVIEMFISLK